MPTHRPSGDAPRRRIRSPLAATRVAVVALAGLALGGAAFADEPAPAPGTPTEPDRPSIAPSPEPAASQAATTPAADAPIVAIEPAASQPTPTPTHSPAAATTPLPAAPPITRLPPDIAARAFTAAPAPIIDAREAFRRRDAQRLAALRASVQGHPLASWVEYWELTNRLEQAQADELEAFYVRWKGRYVEDRLRNDWLLELGRRRDWVQLRVDVPRFRMNDDREVTCHALTAQHVEGKPVKDAALEAWLDQKDIDDGCHRMAATLLDARVFSRDDVWRKVRRAVDQGRPRTARQAAGLIDDDAEKAVGDIVMQPARWLNHKADTRTRRDSELTSIALARLAAGDPELAMLTLRSRWEKSLPGELLAWTWAQIGEHAAQKVMPDAHDHVLAALRAADASPAGLAALGDESLAWAVRAALRSAHAERWRTIDRAIAAMRPATRDDATWRYWAARAVIESTPKDAPQRTQAREALASLAGELHFYGVLAAEDLGRRFMPPARPAPANAAERDAARGHPGLASGLALIAAGLRDEGNREWNYSLRGMSDRELLAAAQWACDREVWDRCINTSDRTRTLVDVAQRYPTPFRTALEDAARASGVEAAFAYGVIRQESRFITHVRSHVGASGLMQLMPATARWTARRLGMPLAKGAVIDPDVNLRLGTTYLKLVLDDFEGSHAMAVAAYNAGPSRPRRWREGPPVEAAAWAETIPFDETRDYVKKVLTNTIVYAARLGADATRTSLKARLGPAIGPREATARAEDRELP